MKIGILAIHGSVEEHAKCLEKLGVEVCYVKLPEDLKGISGLIIPSFSESADILLFLLN